MCFENTLLKCRENSHENLGRQMKLQEKIMFLEIDRIFGVEGKA
jgi:hypothetical protein